MMMKLQEDPEGNPNLQEEFSQESITTTENVGVDGAVTNKSSNTSCAPSEKTQLSDKKCKFGSTFN